MTSSKPQRGSAPIRTATWRSSRTSSTANSSIAIWQDATCYVARVEGTPLALSLGADRYGFLFLAGGEAEVAGESLRAGDALRLQGPLETTIRSAGAELVFWDTPSLDQAQQSR